MILHEICLPTEFDCIYLVPISDMHLGDHNVNLDKFYGYQKWIKETPNAFVLLNGDIMNTATKNSVSDVYSETCSPKEQVKLAEKLFSPIVDKILAITSGNHERRIYKESGIDISETFADKLKEKLPQELKGKRCYYSPDEAFLKLKFGKDTRHSKPVTYCVYMTHGWGAGRTAGGKVNNLQKMSDIVLSDIYIASHTHFMTAHQDVYFVPDEHNRKVREVKRTYVSSGAFLDRGGYAVQFGFPAAKLGSPRLRLDGRRKDCHVSI